MNNENLRLIDSILVEVTVKKQEDLYEERESGILTPTEDPSKKGFNFGKILVKPSVVTEEKYRDLANMCRQNDVAFFSASKSYNYIPQNDDAVKLLIIPLYDIDALFYVGE